MSNSLAQKIKAANCCLQQLLQTSEETKPGSFFSVGKYEIWSLLYQVVVGATLFDKGKLILKPYSPFMSTIGSDSVM